MAQSRVAALIGAAATHDRPAALVCVNLQNFKALNVVLGHERCDQILAHVQRRLEEMGLTWRTGGDEFVAIQLGPRARWGHAGKLMQPWNVVENVPRDVLVSPGDQRRRHVVFRPKEAGT